MSLELKLDRGTIRIVCDALAKAMHPAGLSDAEINRYLSVCGIQEPEHTQLSRGNKRDRL
jgi:hypothetical protein